MGRLKTRPTKACTQARESAQAKNNVNDKPAHKGRRARRVCLGAVQRKRGKAICPTTQGWWWAR